jgi:hypothetical protein
LQKLSDEREKESHRYFNNLAGDAIIDNPVVHNDQHFASPIETVFQLNLREPLFAYQLYLEDLGKEKETLQKKVKSSFGFKLIDAKDNAELHSEL